MDTSYTFNHYVIGRNIHNHCNVVCQFVKVNLDNNLLFG
jgi:hypothetical protein